MVERLRALQRIQGEFKVHFETLDTLFHEHVALQGMDGLDQARTVERVLAPLVNHVREDVKRIHERARPIADINIGLARTSLEAETDLSRFVTPDTRYAGLNWLLTPERLELWYQIAMEPVHSHTGPYVGMIWNGLGMLTLLECLINQRVRVNSRSCGLVVGINEPTPGPDLKSAASTGT